MWKEIEGFKNYQVSKSGLVRNKITKRILSPFVNNTNQYIRVNMINNNGEKAKALIHVLVAKAFIKNPLNLREVNHKNNKRYDNRVCNLEWTTHSENMLQVWRTGTRSKRLKTKGKKNKANKNINNKI